MPGAACRLVPHQSLSPFGDEVNDYPGLAGAVGGGV